MLKILFLCLLAINLAAFADSLSVHSVDSLDKKLQNEPLCLWQRSAAKGNLPEWLLPDQDGERGMAFYNEKLYIVSRGKGTSVRIVDAKTGNDDGTLIMDAVIKGGTYLLNDIEADSSGNLLACNLAATPKSRNFKIYRWKNKKAKPELFISYDNLQNFRLGDHISLFGNIENKADIYAVAAGTDKVLHWQVLKGKVSKEPSMISLINLANCGSAPYIAPIADDGFMLNANSITPKLFTKNGLLTGSYPETVIPTGSTIFKRVITSGDTVLLFYLSTAAAKGGQSVRAIRKNNLTTEMISSADILFTTPPLGTNVNSNFVGDIAYNLENGKLNIFVLATNNGLAAYSYNLPNKSGSGIGSIVEEIHKPELPPPPVLKIPLEFDLSENDQFMTLSEPETVEESKAVFSQIELPVIAFIEKKEFKQVVEVISKPEFPPAPIMLMPFSYSLSKKDQFIQLPELKSVIETKPARIEVTNKPPIPPAYNPPKVEKIVTPIIQNSANALMTPIKKDEIKTINFKVNSPQTVGFLVFNIKGDLVYSFQQYVMPGENYFLIPLKGWRNGIYPYKIILEDRIISGKTLWVK